MPEFISTNGALTPDGERLITWIEAQFAEADKANDMSAINGLSGYLSYYYVNVNKLKALTPAQWIAEHQHSGAAAAWRDMLHLEEVARKEAEQEASAVETKEQVAGIAGQIEALQRALNEALAEIATLKEAQAEPEAEAEPEVKKPARKSRKTKAQEAETEQDTDETDDAETDEEAAAEPENGVDAEAEPAVTLDDKEA